MLVRAPVALLVLVGTEPTILPVLYTHLVLTGAPNTTGASWDTHGSTNYTPSGTNYTSGAGWGTKHTTGASWDTHGSTNYTPSGTNYTSGAGWGTKHTTGASWDTHGSTNYTPSGTNYTSGAGWGTKHTTGASWDTHGSTNYTPSGTNYTSGADWGTKHTTGLVLVGKLMGAPTTLPVAQTTHIMVLTGAPNTLVVLTGAPSRQLNPLASPSHRRLKQLAFMATVTLSRQRNQRVPMDQQPILAFLSSANRTSICLSLATCPDPSTKATGYYGFLQQSPRTLVLRHTGSLSPLLSHPLLTHPPNQVAITASLQQSQPMAVLRHTDSLSPLLSHPLLTHPPNQVAITASLQQSQPMAVIRHTDSLSPLPRPQLSKLATGSLLCSVTLYGRPSHHQLLTGNSLHGDTPGDMGLKTSYLYHYHNHHLHLSDFFTVLFFYTKVTHSATCTYMYVR